jgi:hypothetical protein
MDLEGKVALVTGGSGDIGGAIARALAAAGAEVAVSYLGHVEGATATADAVQAAGRQSLVVQLDQRDPVSIDACNDDDKQITTHFLSPNQSSNPSEAGMARATWQHSRDTSTVWALPIASSSDPGFVARGAIPWLLLQVVGAVPGPTGGHRLTETTYIQRVHTSGGMAPTTGCAQSTHVGNRALVPYTADYVFYKAIEDEDVNREEVVATILEALRHRAEASPQ